MRGYTYLIIGILCGMLAGCDGDGILRGEEDAARYPVSFGLPELDMPTRAADGSATGLSAGTELTIAAYNPNTKALVTQRKYKVDNNANGLVLDDTEEMYLPVGTYDFCAMNPAQTLAADGRSATVAKEIDALGSVTRGQMQSQETAIQLNNLEHLTSQISFTVQVVKQKAKSIQVFEVQSIEIDGMVTAAEGNYKLPENLLEKPVVDATNRYETLTISGTGAFNRGDQGDGSKPGFVNKQQTPLIVFPKEESSFSATVKVNIQTATETSPTLKDLKVKINRLAFAPGKRYLFEVNYGWDYVRFSISVADWTTIQDTGEVGSGEQTVGNALVIAEWEEKINLDMEI